MCFHRMKSVITNTRKRALECYIEPFLVYVCYAWTTSHSYKNVASGENAMNLKESKVKKMHEK